MASSTCCISILFLLLITTHSICSAANPPPGTGNLLRTDAASLKKASTDYGNITHDIPSGLLYPSTEKDIIDIIGASYRSTKPFKVAARGNGHSVRGQSMAVGDGVVVDMSGLGGNRSRISIEGSVSTGFYADVGGEQLWIDVLNATVGRGLAPVSWTDYVYLTVGGTLSNAGISGQTHMHGPQIVNVLELDVVTGKGEFLTCSREKNPELFYGVLGGLGQFGIITRARIVLKQAPTRVKWAKLLYSDFSAFSKDQEYLIATNDANYLEGFLITNENAIAESWSSSGNQSDVVALLKEHGILYAIELVKYYDNQTAATIDQEFQTLLNTLHYIPSYNITQDATFFNFIDRVPDLSKILGPPQSHPWLNLFIPKSRISDFNAGVLAGILPKINQTGGLFIFYPVNRNKWDERMTAVSPDEDVFYVLSLLHTSSPDNYEYIDGFNKQIIEFCRSNGIKMKEYLPNIKSRHEWMKHFGAKWRRIQQKKTMFDPRRILAPGQRIFN